MNVRPFDVYDDCSTLVMPTRPPSHATSSVIPIERSRDAREGAVGQPIRSSVRAVRGDGPVSIARSRADEKTQPTLRYTSDLQRYRRLSLMLGISLAFVLGITASLAAQISAHFTPTAARAPRDGITRGEWLSLFDGVETKVAPSARARRPIPRSTAPAPSTVPSTATAASASAAESMAASPAESTSATLSAAAFASPLVPTAPSGAAFPAERPSTSGLPNDGASDLAGRDLLREGLSAD